MQLQSVSDQLRPVPVHPFFVPVFVQAEHFPSQGDVVKVQLRFGPQEQASCVLPAPSMITAVHRPRGSAVHSVSCEHVAGQEQLAVSQFVHDASMATAVSPEQQIAEDGVHVAGGFWQQPITCDPRQSPVQEAGLATATPALSQH